MGPELLFVLGLAAMLALPLAIRLLAGRLPVAPACPSCRAVTRERGEIWLVERLLTHLSLTSVRSCTRCGWYGRMRWRLAADHARRDER